MRKCVYVCARSHTIMSYVCKSSSAERRAVQREVSIALPKHVVHTVRWLWNAPQAHGGCC